ncbi:ubiquinone biosynthesis O-methyltransferase [Eurosta solidaginis]|uniref:ubiquinone biosynthesis O-methyltransferase n=1 Tax=Eurosta solidaginis TaxID=178769 RepID=UPI003530D00A
MSLQAHKLKAPIRQTHRCFSLIYAAHFRNTSTTHSAMPDKSKETQQNTSSTQKEIDHHANLTESWWDVNGTLEALHKLNEIRVPLVRDGLVSRGNVKRELINTTKVLQGQNILEVGCGGGILTEALARLNANVTGIDLGEKVIETARKHLDEHSTELKERITYKIEPIEVHAIAKPNYYDAVVCSEVLEHIDDKAAFLTNCVHTLKPGGSIFITTLNKTLPLYIGGILLAEYVFGLVPKNTHQWNKLASPIEIQRILTALNCQTVLINGHTYDPLRRRWTWIKNNLMCYALQAIKIE